MTTKNLNTEINSFELFNKFKPEELFHPQIIGTEIQTENSFVLNAWLKETLHNNVFDSICEKLAKDLRQLPQNARENKVLAYQKIINTIELLTYIRGQLNQSEEEKLKLSFASLVLPVVMQSEFCRYCHEKPKGYAGDFLCMEKIWSARQGLSASKESVLGQAITDFTIDSANCRANEYRVYQLSRFLQPFRNSVFASVGSGSIIEIRELWKLGRLGNPEIHLFDSDEDTFEVIKQRMPELYENLHFHAGNAIRTVAQSKVQFDCIYSSGLFDYLNLSLAKRFIETLWKKIKPGGSLLIINADPGNPTRLWMEYVGDWFMEYKTKDQLLSLTEKLPSVSKVSFEQDPFVVYNYLEIVKDAAA